MSFNAMRRGSTDQDVLLDKEREIDMRRRLPAKVRMYTATTYAELRRRFARLQRRAARDLRLDCSGGGGGARRTRPRDERSFIASSRDASALETHLRRADALL